MIGDATVKVSCDRVGCWEETDVSLPAGIGNIYIFEVSRIERELKEQCWIVTDRGHFCSTRCAKALGIVVEESCQ